jgi:hypothetical protein
VDFSPAGFSVSCFYFSSFGEMICQKTARKYALE